MYAGSMQSVGRRLRTPGKEVSVYLSCRYVKESLHEVSAYSKTYIYT